MKIPNIFISEKKLDSKVEELLEEKLFQKPQISKNEIPSYALQKDGDYLIMIRGILTNMPDNRKITSANFYFAINGEEHDLFVGGEIAKLDGRFVELEENLISNLFELGLTSSYEQEYKNKDSWGLDMTYLTKKAYKELVKLVK